MREVLNRVGRLPKTVRNPFKQPSSQEKAVGVLASLNSLPDFDGQEDELAKLINAVNTPSTTSEQTMDLGHSIRDIEDTLRLVESRTQLGGLSEVDVKKYLEALRLQKELSL